MYPFVNFWWFQIGRGLLVSMGILVAWWSRIDRIQDRIRFPERGHDLTYDFIVVGAGSGGNVVANRLSAHFNVLLLEAGGDPFPMTNMPIAAVPLLNLPQIDWMHQTVPQQNACRALVNNRSGWSQGKGLGGTSNTNFLIQSRGHPKDFEQWANLTGDPTWNYENVLQFFKKSEDYAGENWAGSDVHGKGGPVRIESAQNKFNGDLFVNAAKELGYAHVDINGPFSEGFDTITYPIKKGIRQSTYNAYIKPIRKRRSLTIKKFAHVTKILLREDEQGQMTAYGVEYDRHGQRERALAKKEIIISAGVQSPKLLLLSGIGPKTDLEQLGIQVKVNSPLVGRNTQDHISTYLGPFLVNPGSSIIVDRDATSETMVEYIRTGQGVIAQSGCQAIGFISTSFAQSEQQGQGAWPDIQYLFTGVHLYTDRGQDFARAFHISEDIIDAYANRIHEGDSKAESFSIIVSLARPRQRGEIRLKSRDPYAGLVIDPKYFQDDSRDIKVLVEGVKKAVEIVETTETFRKIGAKFTKKPFPGCEVVEFRSDAYWECFIRQLTITLHHIVGTCGMGPNDVEKAVVDSQLRVNGVQNLRVIDASVMPTVLVGNTNAPTIMIGEKGAQLILDRWSVKLN